MSLILSIKDVYLERQSVVAFNFKHQRRDNQESYANFNENQNRNRKEKKCWKSITIINRPVTTSKFYGPDLTPTPIAANLSTSTTSSIITVSISSA